MNRAFLLGAIALIGCGSGSHAPSFKLNLVSAAAAGENGNSPNIEMRAGEIRLLELVVIGSVSEPVTFATAGAPTFVSLAGPILTLAPQRQDAGNYAFTTTARAGGESQSVTLRLNVLRFNSAPKSSASVFGGDAMWCPGPLTCTVGPNPTLVESLCDMEGDGMRLDVEVVPRGQPFTKKPTFSAAVPGVYPPDPQLGGCSIITVEMPGLTPEQSYDFAVRASDEFGAVTVVPGAPDGWLHDASMGFDQGPCVTRTCACPLHLGWPCTYDSTCCSGHCLPDPVNPYGGHTCQ